MFSKSMKAIQSGLLDYLASFLTVLLMTWIWSVTEDLLQNPVWSHSWFGYNVALAFRVEVIVKILEHTTGRLIDWL